VDEQQVKLLEAVPTGSVVELVEGRIRVCPTNDTITVAVGDSLVEIGPGDDVVVDIDPVTGFAGFQVNAGTVTVRLCSTSVTLNAGRHARVRTLDKKTIVEINSVSGLIETVTAGVKIPVPEDTTVRIRQDSDIKDVSELLESIRWSEPDEPERPEKSRFMPQ
jgi:hypothetical protein